MSRTVRRSRSVPVSVTFRNRSDCVPTRPTTQLAGPLACTVSTRMGSLKTAPVRIWPGLTGDRRVNVLDLPMRMP